MKEAVFRLLGPLDVRIDGESIRLGGPRHRTILAMLLLTPGRTVSVDALTDAVWPSGAPATARNQIAICVAGLRKLFKDAAGPGELIATSHPGYTINLLEHRIDVAEFDELVSRARGATRKGRPEEACDLFTEALALWRGRFLDGVTGRRIDEEATRLEETHLDVREEHAGLRLELRRFESLIPELTALVTEHPLREQARAHLILAHYRAGRRAEALEVFREGRDLMVQELGIEPGPELRELHELVLHDSPELSGSTAIPTAAPEESAPAELPSAPASFTGRGAELASLDRLLDERSGRAPVAVAAISGVAGIGKTALALHWADRAAECFPDGQLFTDLHGFDERNTLISPFSTLERFLRALGVPASRIPGDLGGRAALFRSVLDGKRVLIVLDNARSFHQIRPLMPGNGRCCVVITSRERIEDLISHYTVVQVGLGALAPAEAPQLLAELVGEQRVATDQAAALRLGELCDGLPLALQIAGARLVSKPHWSVRHLTTRLEDPARLMDELSPSGSGVRAGFELSYRALPVAGRRLFRRLALLNTADFAAWAGAAVLDTDPMDAESLVEQLVDAHLVEVVPGSGPPIRYRFQNLVRLFARERAEAEESDEERRAALERFHNGWPALACVAARSRT
ncbi:BTAD domain-containing putative transcriptional regulator [Streptomyces sp. NPDC051322]|uniref:AfsR/SARP family transcriptional regulator n=1 Tax=Streptomyces sp. NPDC051322 TaxID=3154645 RepID=UPI00344FBFAB